MDVTAQNPNINDIWSVSNQTPPTPVDDQNQPVPKKPSVGSFGKPGLAGDGESSDWEDTPTAEELLADARKEEAEHVAEIYKAPEAFKSAEVLKSPEIQKFENKQKKSFPQETSDESLVKKNVVEQRTNREKLHRVDINKADSVTKTADIKEQEFIEGVEREHVPSII